MKKISKLLFLFAATTATFISCADKIDELKDSTDTTNAVASLNIEAANSLDIQTGIKEANEGTTSKKAATAYPKVFNVDFGTGTTINGITRKGKLKITITAPIDNTGSIMTVERIDYYVNGNKLEGTIEYENTTTNITPFPQWTRTVKNGKFTNTNGKVFLNAGTCTVSQTTGINTKSDLSDNTYAMTEGNHTVTNETGNTLTLTVTETLIKEYSCQYISKGKLKIDGGAFSGDINYGNGDCDKSYTFTHKKTGLVFDLSM